jgi:hypothetical protein
MGTSDKTGGGIIYSFFRNNMKYTLVQLKKELQERPPAEVLEVAVKLARFKKENKEYLQYLLFGSEDEKQYIHESQKKLDAVFLGINRSTAYTTKKGLQKVVRHLNKFIKNSKSKETELELRVYFCKLMNSAKIDLHSSKVIFNLYQREIDKIKIVYNKLHEDLRMDYEKDIEGLNVSV